MPITKIPKFIGNYEIVGTLGHGGMGIVYCARDHALQRDLAIKVQSGDWEKHPQLFERFLREARILARINHPNVVQIYAVGDHEGSPYFAMELLEGSIADAARLKSPSVAQACRWMLEAARGLAAIHEMGVVHRDIKPGNLLLTRPTSVEEEHVKVADLGIASAGEQFGAPLTRAGAVLGTTGYLPPESFRLEHTLDSRADQYSLGVVFFELLARRSPYTDMGDSALLAAILEPRTPPDVREFRPEVDPAIAAIVTRMLRDDPAERYESTQALVHALLSAQGAAPRVAVSASIPPVPPPAPRAATPVAAATVPLQPRPPAPPALPVVQTEPDACPSAVTVQRQPARPAPARRALWPYVAGVSAVLVAAFIGLAIYGDSLRHAGTPSSAPADPAPVGGASPEAPATTESAVFQAAEPAITAPVDASVKTLTQVQREAWAKYLLARYHLRSRADDQIWTLDLSEQEHGVISAELTGPEEEAIELHGQVESQREESIDGDDWDIYQVELSDDEGREVSIRFEFTDSDTAGEGSYRYDEERLRFDVEDSTDWDDISQ